MARIRELWETNHQARDMISVLQDEGFEVQERDVNRIRQKNGWLLRIDAARPKRKRRASQPQSSPEEPSADEAEAEEENGEGGEDTTASPGFGEETPAALGDLDLTQAQAAAFQQARKQAIAADAEEKRATKKRRRWLKGRAGLPADPPGPPRFPSELSLTECKAVLALDAATYKDVRAKFRRICEEEGIVKKTLAGPHKWEAVKLQLVRGDMHLRGVFWDSLDVEQKNLALDLVCCDVTKGMRQEGSRMMLHEARNILGLNPKMGRDVRAHLHAILAEDRFVGKIVAGEEHWNALVQRWLAESRIMQPIAASLDGLDPGFAQKKKAIDVVARDAMKRFRDAEVRGLAYQTAEDGQDDQQDAHGETDHEAGGDNNSMAMDMSAFDDTFNDAQIAEQLSMETTGTSNPTETTNPVIILPNDQGPAPPPPPQKKKRGRPRKQQPPAPGEAAASARKHRGRQSKRIPDEEALAIYAHSQARFLPPEGASASAEPEVGGEAAALGQVGSAGQLQFTLVPTAAPVSAPVSSPTQSRASATSSSTATPPRARTQPAAQSLAPARPQAAPPTTTSQTTAIYFRLRPSSTVSGVPAVWIATLPSRHFSVAELRAEAVVKCPGAVCVAVDGIVKPGGAGGGEEVPLPVHGDAELGAYLDHVMEVGWPPTFAVELLGTAASE